MTSMLYSHFWICTPPVNKYLILSLFLTMAIYFNSQTSGKDCPKHRCELPVNYLFLPWWWYFTLPFGENNIIIVTTKFDNIYGLEITENLMNIISYHVFSRYVISTFILSCRSALFPHYLFKGFIIVETK